MSAATKTPKTVAKAVAKALVKPPVAEVDEQKKKNRSFKVKLSEDGELYGRYNGDSPYQAANKALSEIIRNKVKANEKVDGDISFFLVESTKGSSKKTHQYLGKRVQLDTPVKYKVGNQEIIKNFKNILKKVKRTDTEKDGGGAAVATAAPAKKVAAKKVAAKKVVAKKVAAKKVAAKKVAAKKVVAKKVAATA
jgi:hypothetical protein